MKNVLLFGTGPMAEEYLKVLHSTPCATVVIGRNREKAVALAQKYSMEGYGGGVSALSNIKRDTIGLVIVATAIDSLKEVVCACLAAGYTSILLEKPGGSRAKELEEIKKNINSNSILRIAYNRRLYNSVITLKKHIQNDGGLTGCFFDFTDREKDILSSDKSVDVKKRWGFSNSSHVIDTAFYLAGFPKTLHSQRAGSWDLHPTGNVFVGCGETENCLFSYFSSWNGGGRWNVEISTNKGRYKLSPMETLQFCTKNQFEWEQFSAQDADDRNFKPGLYKIVTKMLEKGDIKELPDIDQQILLCKKINTIFGYEN